MKLHIGINRPDIHFKQNLYPCMCRICCHKYKNYASCINLDFAYMDYCRTCINWRPNIKVY